MGKMCQKLHIHTLPQGLEIEMVSKIQTDQNCHIWANVVFVAFIVGHVTSILLPSLSSCPEATSRNSITIITAQYTNTETKNMLGSIVLQVQKRYITKLLYNVAATSLSSLHSQSL